MRKIVFLALLPIFLLSKTGCDKQAGPVSQKHSLNLIPDMKELFIYDLGANRLGTKTELFLELHNNLSFPVVINEARVFCNCTFPEYAPEPIHPGKSSIIKITFAGEQTGPFSKSVKIFFNFKKVPVEIKLTGEVLKNETTLLSH
ncbi:DUF1573 domain-containing protein [Gaoshiqia sp. Z1-71]|uniref:DUF1573 domain-containing protein n=1 Tax=Gaoshiqia hydrogeniformans TaxID=3290090 RepID=UPI003BF88ADA